MDFGDLYRVPVDGLRNLTPPELPIFKNPDDVVDDVVGTHMAMKCPCYQHSRSYMSVNRAKITQQLLIFLRKQYQSPNESDVQRAVVCVKRLLFQDFSHMRYVIRYACGYISGILAAVIMSLNCYCPYIYPGLHSVVPRVCLAVNMAIVECNDAAAKVYNIMISDTAANDLVVVEKAQKSMEICALKILLVLKDIKTFFADSYIAISAQCTCNSIYTDCKHPCIFSNPHTATECRCNMTKEYIHSVSSVAKTHLRSTLKSLNTYCRKYIRMSKVMGDKLLEDVKKVVPRNMVTHTVHTLYRARDIKVRCSFYEALLHIIKVNPTVSVTAMCIENNCLCEYGSTNDCICDCGCCDGEYFY